MKITKYQVVLMIVVVALSIGLLGVMFYDFSYKPIFFILIVAFISFALGSYFVGLSFYMPILNSLPQTNKNTIALSFDDGPTTSTNQLLDLLSKHDVKANFFCIGKNIENHPEEVSRMLAEGHLLGNHSYSHSNFFALSSFKKVYDELHKTNVLIEGLSHKKNAYFRPPFGVTNPIIARVVSQLGMTTVGWSLRSYDTVISQEKLLQKLKKKTRNGSIILLHDRADSLEVLDEFLSYAKTKGFQFALISDFE